MRSLRRRKPSSWIVGRRRMEPTTAKSLAGPDDACGETKPGWCVPRKAKAQSSRARRLCEARRLGQKLHPTPKTNSPGMAHGTATRTRPGGSNRWLASKAQKRALRGRFPFVRGGDVSGSPNLYLPRQSPLCRVTAVPAGGPCLSLRQPARAGRSPKVKTKAIGPVCRWVDTPSGGCR